MGTCRTNYLPAYVSNINNACLCCWRLCWLLCNDGITFNAAVNNGLNKTKNNSLLLSNFYIIIDIA